MLYLVTIQGVINCVETLHVACRIQGFFIALLFYCFIKESVSNVQDKIIKQISEKSCIKKIAKFSLFHINHQL